MIPMSLIFLLLPGEDPPTTFPAKPLSLELLEYIGSMKQTIDGKQVAPMEAATPDDTQESKAASIPSI
ncbi:MAG TPA: hypothetical protein ENG92_02980 [Thiolapillus brandeum]|uniref:Uncharacterized protein n=1 Tax=Thiolapillus brandeum TaxID=1076588 RepID=A0A831NY46_9GAMM|nr:hypothetical protein [Thiolapillus brandeum]